MTTVSAPSGRAASHAVRPGLRRSQRRRRLTAYGMLAPALLGLAVFFGYPLIASIVFSFTRYNLLDDPQWIGLRNYEYLFTQDPKVWVAAATKVVCGLPGCRCASCARSRSRGCRACQAGVRLKGPGLLTCPLLTPPVASVVAFVFLFNPGTGPVNAVIRFFGGQGPLWFNDPALSKPSLLLLGVWVLGDIMIIFLAALLDVPREQYEAAELDGANAPQRFRYVTFPNLVPVLVFALVTGVIAALQYFTEAAVASTVALGKASVGEGAGAVLGYPDDSLLTYTQWLYVRGFSNYQLGYASALAVLLFVVAALFLVLLLRRVDAFTPEEAQG
ncbi:MAG: sugar ABC transporter permease [Schumannella sp.]